MRLASPVLGVVLGAASLAACASVDTTPSARLTSGGEGLTQSKAVRARGAFRVDAPAVRAAKTVRIEPARLSADADGKISDRQAEVLSQTLNQSLCSRLSRHFEIVPAGAPADLVVRADIARLQTTGAGTAAASRVIGFASPVPFTRACRWGWAAWWSRARRRAATASPRRCWSGAGAPTCSPPTRAPRRSATPSPWPAPSAPTSPSC